MGTNGPKSARMPEPLRVFWRSTSEGIRVWRSDWASDAFDIVDNERFMTIQSVCSQLAIPLKEAED